MDQFNFNCWRGTYEALGCIVHEAELEALLVEEGLGQSAAESIGGQGRLLGELQLREQLLQQIQRGKT